MLRIVTGLWLTWLLAGPAMAGYSSGACIGDCDDDGVVKVHELITSVRVALGDLPEDVCPNGGPSGWISGLVTAVRTSLEGCSAQRDFSTFTRFSFGRHSGYGFCPPLGVFTASIAAAGYGFRFTRSVLVAGVPGVDACLEHAWGPVPCLVEQPDADRLLSADEVRQVRDAFAAVEVYNGPDSFCLSGVVDPCLINVLTWDAQSISDFTCDATRVHDADVSRLDALLAALPN
ncbi:MAG: hypothetical protein ABI629_09335 [bacterium]